MPAGRPTTEFNKKQFVDLVGLGCNQVEISWFFRDETGKPANIDTLSRWCKRTFGMNFQEYCEQNGGVARNIEIRKNQLALSKRSAAMAIFLGKNYLGQSDHVEVANDEAIAILKEILANNEENARIQTEQETE